MKFLHTSDWHLGRTLYGQKRYDEFNAFLDWLAQTISANQVNVLLVAGDVFDTSIPSNRAQELYYRFLCKVAISDCRHVVVIAGNHDSPSFLNAPKELLKALDVHVIGSVTDSFEDEVLVLKDDAGVPELIICAVPYLRDRDIRIAEAGESIEDKDQKIIEGIRNHYSAVAELAEKKRQALALDIPIVGMGHLFTAGGQTVDGDGVRELYIGSLANISANLFPKFDYLALGHLHVPQLVSGSALMRYSGSPIAMGFGEARQEKSICLVQFTGTEANVDLLPVPVFQKLERIRGNLDALLSRLLELKAINSSAWLEIIYDDAEVIGDLRENLEAAVAGSDLKLLRVKNNRVIDRVMNQSHESETLDDLNELDVFERCLAVHDISDDQRGLLLQSYQEIITALHEDDIQAE